MPDDDPQNRVFNYAGITSTAMREKNVLDEFCKCMHKHFGASFIHMPAKQALEDGLILSVEGATVDGVIKTSSGNAAVELLGYSPVRDRGDVLEYDYQLRLSIKNTLYGFLKSRQIALSISYKEVPRGRPQDGLVYHVPRQKKHGAIAKELREILKHFKQLKKHDMHQVRFVDARHVETMNRSRPNVTHLDASKYPCNSEYFQSLRAHGTGSAIDPDVSSNLSCGAIWLDTRWVEAQIVKKAKKSNNFSLARAHGLPLWLIVHSDGAAIHQKIHRSQREKAALFCREILDGLQHSFTRAYWADQSGFLNATRVRRIL